MGSYFIFEVVSRTPRGENNSITKMTVIILISFVIFFCLHFFCTQTIYSKNYFLLLLIVTLLIPIACLLFLKHGRTILIINAGLLCVSYTLLLFAIKKGYKRINKELIRRGFIDIKYDSKDFTYVLWDGDIPTAGSWWNEKLTSKPSWLDHLLTYALLVIPIVLFWLVNLLTPNTF